MENGYPGVWKMALTTEMGENTMNLCQIYFLILFSDIVIIIMLCYLDPILVVFPQIIKLRAMLNCKWYI